MSSRPRRGWGFDDHPERIFDQAGPVMSRALHEREPEAQGQRDSGQRQYPGDPCTTEWDDRKWDLDALHHVAPRH